MADVLMQRDGRQTEVHENSVEIMRALGWEVAKSEKKAQTKKTEAAEKAK